MMTGYHNRHEATASGDGTTVTLRSDMLIGIESGRARARHGGKVKPVAS